MCMVLHAFNCFPGLNWTWHGKKSLQGLIGACLGRCVDDVHSETETRPYSYCYEQSWYWHSYTVT